MVVAVESIINQPTEAKYYIVGRDNDDQ